MISKGLRSSRRKGTLIAPGNRAFQYSRGSLCLRRSITLNTGGWFTNTTLEVRQGARDVGQRRAAGISVAGACSAFGSGAGVCRTRTSWGQERERAFWTSRRACMYSSSMYRCKRAHPTDGTRWRCIMSSARDTAPAAPDRTFRPLTSCLCIGLGLFRSQRMPPHI